MTHAGLETGWTGIDAGELVSMPTGASSTSSDRHDGTPRRQYVTAPIVRHDNRQHQTLRPLLPIVTAWATGTEVAMTVTRLRVAPSNQCLGFVDVPNQLKVPTVETKERLDRNVW